MAASHTKKWITRKKRAAIYRRDGHRCVYCGRGRSPCVRLSLDHLTARSRGGGNAATNLATACTRCNTWRGAATLTAFVGATAARQIRSRARRQLVLRPVRRRRNKLSESS